MNRNPQAEQPTVPDFRWVSAHEFMHAMGVDDAIGRENSYRIESIMNEFNMRTQEWDIEKLLRAWNV